MGFIAHTQEELKSFNITAGKSYLIEYINKDYYNAQETIEKGTGVAFRNEDNIYFTVRDPYGMDKMIMKVRCIF